MSSMLVHVSLGKFVSLRVWFYIFEETKKSIQDVIGYVYCPTCPKEKCVYLPVNKISSFYDSKKCKACSHVLNTPFKDQNPTVMLFGGDGKFCKKNEL